MSSEIKLRSVTTPGYSYTLCWRLLHKQISEHEIEQGKIMEEPWQMYHSLKIIRSYLWITILLHRVQKSIICSLSKHLLTNLLNPSKIKSILRSKVNLVFQLIRLMLLYGIIGSHTPVIPRLTRCWNPTLLLDSRDEWISMKLFNVKIAHTESKHVHPFRNVEAIPNNIGDIVISALCGPFESSIGGFRYFVTWIDFKTRYVSIEFLKNKECRTVTDSFKRYLAWISRQKNIQVKRVRSDNGGKYTGKEFEQLLFWNPWNYWC